MSTRDQLVQAVFAEAKQDDDKHWIPCAAALNLARTYNVTPREIGDICNEQDIRIRHCQLGCFK